MSRRTTKDEKKPCGVRGCIQKPEVLVMPDYSHSYQVEAFKQYVKPHCKGHVLRQCAYYSCGAQQRHDYCEDHRCIEAGCEKASKFADYKCRTHTNENRCIVAECDYAAPPGQTFCTSRHACTIKSCRLQQSKSSSYCVEHQCKSVSYGMQCSSPKLEGAQLCHVHKCKAEPFCTAQSYEFASYCPEHQCHRYGCLDFGDSGGLCSHHSTICAASSCQELKDEESKYCTEHRCQDVTCTGKNTCVKHQCKACESFKTDNGKSYCQDCICRQVDCKEKWQLPNSRLCLKHADEPRT